MIKGRLYIFAHQIIDPGGVFNTLLIRVANPLDSPERWSFDYLNMGIFKRPTPGISPREAAPVHFGTEVILDEPGNFLYTYGCYANNASAKDFFNSFTLFPVRIPLDKVETMPANGDLGRVAQFMAKDGTWRDGLHDPNDFHPVGIPSFNSFSVRYNKTLKAYQALFAHDKELAQYLAANRAYDDPKVNSVWMKVGPTPYGPWSEPRVVAKYPEMDARYDGIVDRPHGKECYGYFMNERPEFETGDSNVVFCYTIGSYTEGHGKNSDIKNGNLKLYNVYSWSAPNPFFVPAEVPQPAGLVPAEVPKP
jgi:hypothetical protein